MAISHGIATQTPGQASLRNGLRMETGEGEASYSQNSAMVQGAMVHDTGPQLAEAIGQLRFERGFDRGFDGNVVRVADFGCSVGANAVAWAHLAAVSVLQNCRSKNSNCSDSSPEIQYFFCDLPSNDFSTLFREFQQAREAAPAARPAYFAAAVGGSFHDRLFPRGALHVAISTWSLHWMSKIPEAVEDMSSGAYNKGRLWIQDGNPAVAEAYAAVAKQDLLNFFTHRAHELAPAGLLFVVGPCRAQPGLPHVQTSTEFHEANPIGAIFDASWEDLVAEGVIQAQEWDSFNIPVFHPSRDEIEEAINKTGAYDIKRLEVHRDYRWLAEGSQEAQHFRDNPAAMGAWAKSFVRAIFNPLVEAHLGPARAHLLWERLQHNFTAYVKRTQNIFLTMPGANYALIVLSRKL